nr:zinc finger, CCHC-type [Tanacetum cinerariifolium]
MRVFLQGGNMWGSTPQMRRFEAGSDYLLGGAEQQQMTELLSFIDYTIISSTKDRWYCDLTSDGIFRVKEFRNLIDDKFLPSHHEATKWVKCVPIKVNVFMWRARRNGLPTRLNLGFLRETKTDWTSFIDWYRQLRIVPSIEDKLNYLEQPIPPAPVAPAGQHVALEILAAHNAWIKGSKEIVGLMLMTMEPEIQPDLEPLHAHEMIRKLKTLFAQQAEQELLQTTRDFHSYRSCTSERGEVYYECMEPFKSLKRLWIRNRIIAAIWLEKVVMPLIEPAIKGFAATPAVLKPERLKVDKTWYE